MPNGWTSKYEMNKADIKFMLHVKDIGRLVGWLVHRQHPCTDLISVARELAPVVGARLSFDPETGKARGDYGTLQSGLDLLGARFKPVK